VKLPGGHDTSGCDEVGELARVGERQQVVGPRDRRHLGVGEEAREADRIVVLHRGAVLADGSWRALCSPVAGAIRLRVRNVGIACRWLAAQGYAVKPKADAAIVSCVDAQAALPSLLQRIPFEVFDADIATPSLMDVIGHWTGASPCTATPVRTVAEAAS